MNRALALSALLLLLLPASVARAQYSVADEINADQSPYPGSFNPPDIGWYYTPDENYTLVRINTKFADPADGRNITINVYTERPALGGQLLATESFSSLNARLVLGGADLDQPVELVAGTRYFIGVLNIQFHGLNLTRLDNNCAEIAGVDNLTDWATSGNANDGQFATLFTPTAECPVQSFAQPILQFLTEGPEPTPTPEPTPEPTASPTPTPTPTPVPCANDNAVPEITGADLPFSQTVQTAANFGDFDFDFGGADPFTPDAYWYFNPTVAGQYQISLTGYDTFLGFFTGTCCEPIVFGTQDFSLGGEYAVATLTAGRRILLVAKGKSLGDVGEATLKIEGPLVRPANDFCGTAFVIDPAAVPYSREINISAAVDFFDSSISQERVDPASITRDLWWRFTPTQSGLYEIRATAYRYDIFLSAYSGACGSLVELESLDTPFISYFGEHMVLPLEAGVAYNFLVEAFSTLNRGPLVFELRGPGLPSANAECANATVIPPAALPYDAEFDTTFNASLVDGSAVAEASDRGAPDAWWRFTPAQAGTYVIGLRAMDSPDPTNPDLSLIDEALTIYTGECGSLTELSSLDTLDTGEMAILELTAGVAYTILTEGYSGYSDFGRMRLTVEGPVAPSANNHCDELIEIPAGNLPYETTVNTLLNTNTIDPFASALRGGGGGPDASYGFTPLVTGVYTFEVDLPTGGLGADIDLALGVYTADCNTPVEIGSVDAGEGIKFTPERLAVALNGGQPYLVVVDGHGPNDGGPITLRARGPFTASANDLCSSDNAACDWPRYH